MARKALGRGVGALIGGATDKSIGKQKNATKIETKTESNKIDQIVDIKENLIQESIAPIKEDAIGEVIVKLSLVDPNVNQPRKRFDEETLEELTESVRQYGILQPLLVKKKGKRYEIIAGERRFRAAKKAGLKEIPVVIREYDTQTSKEIAIIENIQRTDLNPIEEALGYQSLIEEYHLTQEEVSRRVAKNRTSITNALRLLKLEEEIQVLIVEGKLSSGHARALLSIESGKLRLQVAKDIVLKSLSVREVENIVKSFGKAKKEPVFRDKSLDIFFKEYENHMRDILGTKVSINRKDSNKGRIEIDYYSSAELERIMDLLKSIE